MSRTYKIILGLIIVVLGTLIYLEASQPKPLNWRPTYSRHDKIPLGTYVFFHSLKKVAKDLKTVSLPPYKFLRDSSVHGTYFFVGNVLNFNPTETKELLNWVKKGNTLFVSANNYSQSLLDSLHLKLWYKLRRNSLINRPVFNLVNPHLENARFYYFNHNHEINYFKSIDTATQIVLGQARLEVDSMQKEKGEINFVKAPLGKGKILLQSSPEVFSNFFMLTKKNYRYVEDLLAYIDLQQPLYFDTYGDPARSRPSSPLYILLHNKQLKWAYYLILIGAVLFVIFEGKRKQKSIPVIQPLRNQTYDYTRTIAGMYLDKKDHTTIAHKRIDQFLNFIKTDLRTDFSEINRDLITRLTELTHNRASDIKELFDEIQRLQKSQLIDKKDLISLQNKINAFKENL